MHPPENHTADPPRRPDPAGGCRYLTPDGEACRRRRRGKRAERATRPFCRPPSWCAFLGRGVEGDLCPSRSPPTPGSVPAHVLTRHFTSNARNLLFAELRRPPWKCFPSRTGRTARKRSLIDPYTLPAFPSPLIAGYHPRQLSVANVPLAFFFRACRPCLLAIEALRLVPHALSRRTSGGSSYRFLRYARRLR